MYSIPHIDLQFLSPSLTILQGQFENAIKLYQLCLGRAPDYHILTFMARAYVRNGQARQARAMLQRALHINPTDDTTRYNLAVTLMHSAAAQLQRDEAGVQDLQAAQTMLACVCVCVCTWFVGVGVGVGVGVDVDVCLCA